MYVPPSFASVTVSLVTFALCGCCVTLHSLSAARGCVFAWGSGKKGQLGMGPERNGTVNEPQKGEESTTASLLLTCDLRSA